MSKKLFMLVSVVFVLALALAACGPSVTPTAPPVVEPTATSAAVEEPATIDEPDEFAMYAPNAVSGAIVTAGSSTVFPLSERMKQRFEEEGFTGQITIDSIGSGGGFERFCVTGETDVANASRAIKSSEAESCNAIGREPLEFRVGTDALAVVVSSENTFVSDVTSDELAMIFSSAVKWSDVRTEWPNEDILRFIPGTDSGTFDYFVEAIMAPAYKDADGKASVENGEAAILAAGNLQMSEDDNVLVHGVEGSPYAIGFFGFAYYQENKEALNVLSVDGVAPTAETAENNSYPISRPLFIYSTATILREKPQVAAFVYFYLTNVNNEILDVGYFPASEDALQSAIDAWIVAVTD
jgi:phosphate transport system substrate-binding protein